ncbi:hypothetical protein M2158_006548 [Streptomyces sp. SAI-144]|uniref:hypothetical protein n=1 Tax=Streptomyces sp. SAI-144 TaxID=2940544 RepID=UPI0024736120|nr:hypothetical protein [Streptomyces sp. SAI-144]MDH6438007.1 hypothetical protein [Streptomyces sp. SAI-144]
MQRHPQYGLCSAAHAGPLLRKDVRVSTGAAAAPGVSPGTVAMAAGEAVTV